MASNTWNDIKQWKILPIKQVSFWYGSDYDAFEYLDESSELAIAPILRPNDIGGQTIVAFHVKGKIVVIQNNYGDMKATLLRLQDGSLTQIRVSCQALTGQVNGSTMTIQFNTSTYKPTVDDYSANWEIKWNATSPELIISFDRFVSLDAISSSNFAYFITQGWSS